jgi:uncharacterized oxidoreductase
MITLEPAVLTDFVGRILKAAGTPDDIAELVAASLVGSNLAGHDSHGVIRIRQYLDTLNGGELEPAARPVIAQETDTVAVVDGRYGFGQLAADFATSLAIGKARQSGLASVALRNANHVGRLGEWVGKAADQGLIALAFCNGGRPGGMVTPYGGAGRFLGTNPFAAAVPVTGRPPVIIDFSTSVVAEGKVRVARNKGTSIPEGWVQNAQGQPSTDPNDLYAGGTLLPIAGHKGFALSLLVELLGGLLTNQGAPGMPDYRTMRNGVLFLVLDIEPFRSAETFRSDVAVFCERLKAVAVAPGFSEILLPGEPENRTVAERNLSGIDVDEATWLDLTAAADTLGVTVPR